MEGGESGALDAEGSGGGGGGGGLVEQNVWEQSVQSSIVFTSWLITITFISKLKQQTQKDSVQTYRKGNQ